MRPAIFKHNDYNSRLLIGVDYKFTQEEGYLHVDFLLLSQYSNTTHFVLENYNISGYQAKSYKKRKTYQVGNNTCTRSIPKHNHF